MCWDYEVSLLFLRCYDVSQLMFKTNQASVTAVITQSLPTEPPFFADVLEVCKDHAFCEKRTFVKGGGHGYFSKPRFGPVAILHWCWKLICQLCWTGMGYSKLKLHFEGLLRLKELLIFACSMQRFFLMGTKTLRDTVNKLRPVNFECFQTIFFRGML